MGNGLCEVKKIIDQQNPYSTTWGCLIDHMMQFALFEDIQGYYLP